MQYVGSCTRFRLSSPIIGDSASLRFSYSLHEGRYSQTLSWDLISSPARQPAANLSSACKKRRLHDHDPWYSVIFVDIARYQYFTVSCLKTSTISHHGERSRVRCFRFCDCFGVRDERMYQGRQQRISWCRR